MSKQTLFRPSRRRIAEKTPPEGRERTEDEKLDEALDESFPASDPPAMTEPSPSAEDKDQD